MRWWCLEFSIFTQFMKKWLLCHVCKRAIYRETRRNTVHLSLCVDMSKQPIIIHYRGICQRQGTITYIRVSTSSNNVSTSSRCNVVHLTPDTPLSRCEPCRRSWDLQGVSARDWSNPHHWRAAGLCVCVRQNEHLLLNQTLFLNQPVVRAAWIILHLADAFVISHFFLSLEYK